jgi:hypothetical protein
MENENNGLMRVLHGATLMSYWNQLLCFEGMDLRALPTRITRRGGSPAMSSLQVPALTEET